MEPPLRAILRGSKNELRPIHTRFRRELFSQTLLHFSHWPLAPRPLLCRRNRPITPPVGRR